jgi:hypothetical protein
LHKSSGSILQRALNSNPKIRLPIFVQPPVNLCNRIENENFTFCVIDFGGVRFGEREKC